MAAPTTVQKGLDYLLKIASGTTIGGGRDAVLTQNQEYIDTTTRGSSQWKTGKPGLRTWSVAFEGMYLESSDEIAGTTLDFTVGGTSVKGIKDVTMDLSCDLLPSVSSTTGLDREICPSTRSCTMTVSGEWYDFDLDATPTGGDEALEDLVDLIDGTSATPLAVALTFGTNQSFSGNSITTSFELGTPYNGIIPYTVTVEMDAAVTAVTTAADAGLLALLADFFDTTGVQEVGTALLTSATTDHVQWTGSAYPESLNVSINIEGVVEVSGTLQGSGALTKSASA